MSIPRCYYRWLVYQHLFGAPRAIGTLLDIGCDDGGFVARIPAHQRRARSEPGVAAPRPQPESLRRRHAHALSRRGL